MNKILFNEPNFKKKYIDNILDHFENNISYTKKCKQLVYDKYNFKNVIFTTSCTHALEMMAMILNIGYGDEVIIPSYTFVSTANAFVKFGATIKCLDSMNDHPNMDINNIENSITEKTKALVIVHYAGQSCDMNKLSNICDKHNIFLLEDAAQAINSYFYEKPLGSFGILSAFSFHYTKNINCGEGGMLVINDDKLVNKANIICDKGTNRYDFLNKKVNKYEWVSKGSSYPLSEINAAFLYEQLINIDNIINYRKKIWDYYYNNLNIINDKNIGYLCKLNNYNKNNFHIFYIFFRYKKDLNILKKFLNKNNIQSYTHYISLHESEYYKNNFGHISLPNSEIFSNNLLRLPLHSNLSISDCNYICKCINSFYNYNILSITYNNLSEKNIDDIINLKSQFWKYNNESQMEWIQNNMKMNDINIMIYNNEKKLIGYLLIMIRNCYILDSVIIDEKYRGCGFGNIIMKYTMKLFLKKNGFLLCEKNNISFYEKYGWKCKDEIVIKNKENNNNLQKMIFDNNNINIFKY